MERPSNSWTGFGHLDRDSKQYKRMQNLLSLANFEYLKSYAITTRTSQRSLPPNISCVIDPSKFPWGFNNVVLEVALSDGVYWIARVQHAPTDDGARDEEGGDVAFVSEIATMNLVRSRTKIPVPQVSLYVNRISARDTAVFSRDRYLHNITLKLLNGIGRVVARTHSGKTGLELIPSALDGATGIQNTSLEYFNQSREAENRETLAAHPDDADWLTACWVLKIAINHIVIKEKIQGPFPLCHLDLHHGNLLFDKEFNLTGVLDWSHAQSAPFERLAISQEFMTFPALSDEENRPIIEFKKLVAQSLKRKEEQAAPQLEQNPAAQIRLSEFLGSPRSDIAYFCVYSNPRRALWDAERACKLMYGEDISWEHLRQVYGNKPLP
ncbi:hypothetical protein AJ80_07739 [Polytolypa hystricis UAMH7299]|uniref:Aminoglycoside phosphotransferase domain-containing protein n=1 Tax=Polytolypa hystricis (strain UAMH7299) TaxID=1447883 RepID=A0A2B7XJS1_POLH7|nr:hypothetical protein AJ80_07739 [Polytolypa hystricis UAMH7299]